MDLNNRVKLMHILLSEMNPVTIIPDLLWTLKSALREHFDKSTAENIIAELLR